MENEKTFPFPLKRKKKKTRRQIYEFSAEMNTLD